MATHTAQFAFHSPFSHSSKTLVRLPHTCVRSRSRFCVPIHSPIYMYRHRTVLRRRQNAKLPRSQSLNASNMRCRHPAQLFLSVTSFPALVSLGMTIESEGPEFDRMSKSTRCGGMGFDHAVSRMDLWRLFHRGFPCSRDLGRNLSCMLRQLPPMHVGEHGTDCSCKCIISTAVSLAQCSIYIHIL